LTLEKLFRKSINEIEPMKQRMSGLMAEEGLPYGNRTHTFNSRMAQELSKWGEAFTEGELLNRKLFEAYFVKGNNLAVTEVLLDAVESSGLAREEAEGVIIKRRFREAVDEDWQRSRELGVSGVPTFVFGNRALVGAQPYTALEQLIRTK
jgi:predicted DsbA family dithiol-disulfide isomerase